METLIGALQPRGDVVVLFLSPDDPYSNPSMLQKALS